MNLLNGTTDRQPAKKPCLGSSVPEEVLLHPETVYFALQSISYARKNTFLTTSPISIYVLGN